MKTILILLSFFCVTNVLNAQYVPLDAPLSQGANNYPNAWAGGMNLPQFSAVDLNNDNILDLVVFDREALVATTYINGGTANQVDYTYAPEYMSRIPKELVNFALFRDYNCDGIEDIFGMHIVFGQGARVGVWKGSYDANDTIQFVMEEPALTYDGGASFPYSLFIFNTDLPSIDDIDGDGDLDILSFTLDICFSKNVFWYRNLSVENGHGCDSLEFDLGSECWGLFEETGDSSKVNMSSTTDSCYNNAWFNQKLFARPDRLDFDRTSRNGRHIGANITTIDMDGDSVKEMTLGGVTFKNVNVVSGVEINDTVLITSQDYQFPSYNKPVDEWTFVSTYYLDVNNDGNIDMINCPSETGIGESVLDSVAWYYQNTNSNTNMIFDFQQKDFLVGEMLDIGHRAFPTVIDYNGDGLKDILLGTFGRPLDGQLNYKYGMTLLENYGTALNPAFEVASTDFALLDSLQMNGLHPTFGDLDGDGDMDMICGNQDGTLLYFENTAGVGVQMTFDYPVMNFSGIDVGDASSPVLVDLDRDNDLDLVVGRFAGSIHYYENGGDASNFVFSPTPVTTNLGGYDIQAAGSRNSMPYFYDNGGAYELFIGHQSGNIIHLGNIDNDIMGVYDTLTQEFQDFRFGRYTDIAIADLDGDSKVEYILGTGRGGVVIMTEQDTFTNLTNVEIEEPVVELFPNPAADQITIRFLHQNKGSLQIKVYNALGQVLLESSRTNSNKHYQVNISNLPTGVHFMEIQTGSHREVLPFVKQ